MPRGGRYRYVRVAMWGDPGFQALSADARLLLLNLRTGSSSNLPGINYVYEEALERETGLSHGEIRNAFAELQKRGFVVLDRGVAWVKDQLKTDPTREDDPECTNLKHRKNIENILGELPRESLAVKKFRDYYKFHAHRVSRTPRHTPPATPDDTVGASPNPNPRHETRDRKQERESRGKTQDVALATDSNGTEPATAPVKLADAPAEWFNDCGDGRLRRSCVKTEFLPRVDGGTQCYAHEKARQELAR